MLFLSSTLQLNSNIIRHKSRFSETIFKSKISKMNLLRVSSFKWKRKISAYRREVVLNWNEIKDLELKWQKIQSRYLVYGVDIKWNKDMSSSIMFSNNLQSLQKSMFLSTRVSNDLIVQYVSSFHSIGQWMVKSSTQSQSLYLINIIIVMKIATDNKNNNIFQRKSSYVDTNKVS